MIEIITKDGISLNLDPGSEFEIEMENPMLADDHIPVPFSTDIAFLPTKTNNKVFGYLDALMLEPSVKQVEVTILAGGIPLISGILEYDGIEDRKLNYTFSEKGAIGLLDGYIHEVTHLTDRPDYEQEVVEKSRNEDTLDFNCPMIVTEGNQVKRELAFRSGQDWLEQEVEPDTKFRNWVFHHAWESSFAPVVRVRSVLAKVFDNVIVGDSLKEMFDEMGVLGNYIPEGTFGFNGQTYVLRIAGNLPECTVKDFLTNILRILCASIWTDGGRSVMLSNSDVIGSEDAVLWDDKISDIYSSGTEDGQIYDFGYANDDSENSLETTEDVKETDSLKKFLGRNFFPEGSGSVKVRMLPGGNVYTWSLIATENVYPKDFYFHSSDILYHNLGPSVDKGKTSRGTFNARSDFRLVRCAPFITHKVYENPIEGGHRILVEQLSMCPVVKFPEAGAERPGDVYIGLLKENQFVDGGNVYRRPQYCESDQTHTNNVEKVSTTSLSPAILMDGIQGPGHGYFKEWIEKDRQLVSAELDLSLDDISRLRLYRKVYFRGRVWIIKKLTLTFSCTAGSVAASGDFIAV